MLTVQRKKCKVELHNHLYGSVRADTLFNIAQRRGIDLGVSSPEELQKYMLKEPPNGWSLEAFLEKFHKILTVLQGDPDAIRQIAEEFCEDQANRGVLYSEVRYSPHNVCNSIKTDYNGGVLGNFTPEEVVKCALEGIEKGCSSHGIKVRSILCCFREHPEWGHEVVSLCKKYAGKGVVGMDIAGNEGLEMKPTDGNALAFKEAKKFGIHRTVHCGEGYPAENIRTALDLLYAERIGHGYTLIQDAELYKRVQRDKIHMEECPSSSIKTGACPSVDNHPIKKYINDNLNLSINADDTLIFGHGVSKEYSLLYNGWGCDISILARSTFNAARSAFLPKAEKDQLIAKLVKIYGFEY